MMFRFAVGHPFYAVRVALGVRICRRYRMPLKRHVILRFEGNLTAVRWDPCRVIRPSFIIERYRLADRKAASDEWQWMRAFWRLPSYFHFLFEI